MTIIATLKIRPSRTFSALTARYGGRLSGRVRQRACGFRIPSVPGASRRLRPPVTFPARVSTGASRRQRHGRCPPFHVPVCLRHWPIVQWSLMGGGPSDSSALCLETRLAPDTASGARRRSPLFSWHPRWWSDSDHASKRFVLGQNRESQSKPGNAISQELTSLIYTHITTPTKLKVFT